MTTSRASYARARSAAYSNARAAVSEKSVGQRIVWKRVMGMVRSRVGR